MWSQEYMANVEKVGEKFSNKLYCQKNPHIVLHIVLLLSYKWAA